MRMEKGELRFLETSGGGTIENGGNVFLCKDRGMKSIGRNKERRVFSTNFVSFATLPAN